MVLSEAGAAGLPAVTTRVAAIPEIVQEGETGFLVPAGDEAALVSALARLIANPDLRQSREGRQKNSSAKISTPQKMLPVS
jgi:glycosyltransferase involved in cell wall biosynthesis